MGGALCLQKWSKPCLLQCVERAVGSGFESIQHISGVKLFTARDHVSQKLSAPATTVSLNRLAVATMRRYSPPRTGKKKEAVTCTFISTGRESPAPLQLPRAVLTVVT
jgi:hypothetical protein